MILIRAIITPIDEISAKLGKKEPFYYSNYVFFLFYTSKAELLAN